MRGFSVKNVSVLSDGDSGLSVKNVDFEFLKGEVTVILGPANSGKSLLLGGLGGVVPLSGGGIFLIGDEAESPDSDDSFENISVSYQSESPLLPSSITAKEYCRRLGLSSSVLDLTSFEDLLICELSASQRRLMWVNAVLSREASCYLLDEPALGLDYKRTGECVSALKSRASNAPVLVSTNNPFFAAQAGNRFILFDEGSVGEIVELPCGTDSDSLFQTYTMLVNYQKEQC